VTGLLAGPGGRWHLGFISVGSALLALVLLGEKPWEVEFDQKHRIERFVSVYGWAAALAGMVICALLALVCPWWAGKAVVPGSFVQATAPWFWPVVWGAAAFAAVSAAPRLTHGLWDDEKLNVRMSIVGRYRLREADEIPRFQSLDWLDTAFEYREPNNHPLNSLLARATHSVWRALARPSGLPFTEWPLRLPAFLAAVGGVVALGWMLRVYGMPVAGMLAAWLMALHPWHLRYAAECRGYAFALLLVPILFALWHRAIFRGAWGWWAGLALAQLAVVYAYPGTLFVLVVLHTCALGVLAFQAHAARPFVVQTGRWFCVHALCAMAALFLLLPLLGQVGPWVRGQSEQGFVPGLPWLASTANHFLSGVAWWRGSTAETPRPEIVARMGAALPLYAGVAALTLGAVIAGAFRFARLGLIGVSVVLATLVPPWITYGFAVWKTHIIYEPYVLFALPGVVALAATGLAWVAARWTPPRMRTAALLLPVVLYAWLVWPFREWLISRPLQPTRESVLASRGTLDPQHKASSQILTGSFCIPPYLYDPRMIRLDSTAEMAAFLRRADEERRPLIVNIGMPWAARAYSPGMWALVNDTRLFEPAGTFHGLDAGLDRMLFRYKPGSAATYDFAQVLPLLR
jgi:hypothetical protein